jgi:holin-like protein
VLNNRPAHPMAEAAPTPASGMLHGLTLLLLCQTAGEVLARLAHLPFPGPVLGMLLLAGLLVWPPLRSPAGQAADALLGHLSLLFVPVGVGVMTHWALIGQVGGRLLVVLVLSTWVGLAVTAWVLRAGLPAGTDSAATAEPG